jgi:TIR domain/SIR2-like domain
MDFWEDLLDYIKDGRVVPVVGAELLSIRVNGRDVLLYHHVATMLAAELGIDTAKLPEDFSLNAVVCQYLQTGKPPQTIYRRVKAILDKGPISIPDPLRKLARIKPLKLFVSTSFDSLLEQALNTERFGGASRAITRAYAPNGLRDEADLPPDYHQVRDSLVFRLFGKASTSPDYVVTEEDTLEFISCLQSKERRPNRLFDELKCNHLLFIGNSFSDWLARFFIRLARGQRFLAGGSYMMQYLADEKVRKDSNFIFFLESFGRNQAEIFTDSGPIEFVDQLWERWQERYPEESILPDDATVLPPIDPEKENGIFLSYAREDSEAVLRIAKALEEAGLTVWLDRSRIKHGEEWSEKIHQSILKSSMFFPIVSRTTNARRQGVFFEEWKVAEEKSRRLNPDVIFIIPVPIDTTPVPPRLGSKHFEVFADGHLTPEFIAYIKRVMATIQDQGKRLQNAH